MKEKPVSNKSDLREIEDRFGEEGWGVKKFVNPKKANEGSTKVGPLIRQDESSPDSPKETKPKPKQFLDRNNMFSILPTN